MKKLLLMIVVLTIGNLSFAQLNTRPNEAASKRSASMIQDVNTVITKSMTVSDVQIKKPLVLRKSGNSIENKFSKIKKMQLGNSKVTKFKKEITRASSADIAEIYKSTGESEFDGLLVWRTTTSVDAESSDKLWFANLIPDYSPDDVYGTIQGDNIIIPVGQITGAITISGKKYYLLLAGIDETGKQYLTTNITATIVDGEIVFPECIGVIASESETLDYENSWGDLLLPGTEMVDAIKLPPAYSKVKGSLYSALTTDWYSLKTPRLYASPYTTWTWENISFLKEASFSWSYDLLEGESQIPNLSTDIDLKMDVEADFYTMPNLTSTYAEVSNSYMLNETKDGSLVVAGGMSTLGGDDYGFSNYNPNCGLSSSKIGDGVYAYGTGNASIVGGVQDAVVSLFEKPATTLYFEGIDASVTGLNAPASTEFTIRVITCDLSKNGYPIYKDTIAVGKAIASSFIGEGGTGVIPFTKFVALDEDGFESEIPYVEVDDMFVLELSGFAIPNVTMGMVIEDEDRIDGQNYSFFMATVDGERDLYNWTTLKNTMLFNLKGALLSYLQPSKSVIDAAVEGGTYNFSVIPMLSASEGSPFWLEQDLPEWIKINVIKEDYSDEYWGAELSATVDGLPAGIEGRTGEIMYATWGAHTTITVVQGTTGISSTEISVVKAIKSGDNFDLSYPEEVTSVSVINAAGQSIADYNLPQTGKFNMPAGNLMKGFYILKFNGEKNATVKILK